VHNCVSFAQGNVGDDESRVPRTRRDAQPVDTARFARVSVDERVTQVLKKFIEMLDTNNKQHGSAEDIGQSDPRLSLETEGIK
jgi:hypothetical protein